jgi:choline-sulfatase
MEDTQTRVPLIWRGPGIATGHRVHEPVELFDLMATTLDIAGIECTHPHFARSLVPQLQRQAGDLDRAVFSEGGMGPTMEHGMVHHYMNDALLHKTEDFYHPYALLGRDHPETECNATMIRTLTHKLVYRPLGDGELYDMRADPCELRNLYRDPQHAGIRQTLEKRLLEWLIQTSDVIPHRYHLRGAPAMVWR